MNSASRILLLNLGLTLTVWAVADLPKKPPYTKYAGLWTNSPFTSKPPPPEVGPAVNPLEDYALAGVSPISTGYRVTLLNKKKPEERIVIDSDRPREGFQLLAVTRKPGDPLGTVVRISSGNVIGTVSFDEKLLVLAAPPATKVHPKAPPGVAIPGQPPQPNQPGGNPSSTRGPRPRVVPPPPAGAPTPANATPTPSNSNNAQRSIRRGGR